MNTIHELIHALPRLTAIIGGGGKTTLLLTLGRALAQEGASVLLTTTTHLAWPPPSWCQFIDPATAQELYAHAQPGTVTLAGTPCEGARMVGVPAHWLLPSLYDIILVEADGAHGLPLKVHRADEPCIPPDTGLILQVAGLTALGRQVSQTVHRPSLAGLSGEEPVTPELIAALLLRSLAHAVPSGVPAVTVLNQADTAELSAQGTLIAQLLGTGAEHHQSFICSLRKEYAPCWQS